MDKGSWDLRCPAKNTAPYLYSYPRRYSKDQGDRPISGHTDLGCLMETSREQEFFFFSHRCWMMTGNGLIVGASRNGGGADLAFGILAAVLSHE